MNNAQIYNAYIIRKQLLGVVIGAQRATGHIRLTENVQTYRRRSIMERSIRT